MCVYVCVGSSDGSRLHSRLNQKLHSAYYTQYTLVNMMTTNTVQNVEEGRANVCGGLNSLGGAERQCHAAGGYTFCEQLPKIQFLDPFPFDLRSSHSTSRTGTVKRSTQCDATNHSSGK